MKLVRADWFLVTLLMVLAAVLRLYRLGDVPPGFQFDEAFNAIDAEQVLAGNFPLFLPANAGREVLYTYWQAGLAQLFGLNVYSLRLASALAGIAAIPIAYALIRRLFTRDSKLLAFFTTLVLALSLWHIHFSRYGIRVILMPVLFGSGFACLWLSQHARRKWSRVIAAVISGILVGLSVWTHPTGRLAPVVVVGFLGWIWWRHPHRRGFRIDSALGSLFITAIVAFAVFLPLGLEFYRHPDFFFGHASEVSVFAHRVSGDAPLQVLAQNIWRVLGMFSFRGDEEWTHNLAGRPVFDYAMSIAFVVGSGVWVWRLIGRARPARAVDPDADALFLMMLWSAVMLLPSVLSEAAPNYSRTLPAIPAVFLAAGLGLTALWQIRRPFTWLGLAVVGLTIGYSGYRSVYDYFSVFATRTETYYLYDADKLDALEFLADLTPENHVYLSQLWGDRHATVKYMRGALGIKSLDTADAIVLPPIGKGAVYAFPSEQEERASQVAQLWNQDEVETLADRHGQPLLYLVRVHPAELSTWPPNLRPTEEHMAGFQDAPRLLGMTSGLPDKQVTLFWQAESAISRDLTSFVHLIDADGRRVAQVDRLPANGSFPTTAWTPGERVIDRYYPTLVDPCASGEELRVQVGWYDLASGSELRHRSDAAGTSALAGILVLPYFSYPVEALFPQNQRNVQVTEHLLFAGYATYANDPQPGAPFILDLFWTATDDGDDDTRQDRGVSISLVGSEDAYELWQGSLAPGARWRNNETICRRLRLRLPPDIVPETYALGVEVAKAEQELTLVSFGELTVGPSTRLFDPPPLLTTVQGELAEIAGEAAQIELSGVAAIRRTADEDRTGIADALTVDIVWHARYPIEGNYKVFVHLVDENDRIVGQSDALPLGGYATNRWIPGEYVVDPHRIPLPTELEQGTFRLLAGLYDPVSSHRLYATDGADTHYVNDAVPLSIIDIPLE